MGYNDLSSGVFGVLVYVAGFLRCFGMVLIAWLGVGGWAGGLGVVGCLFFEFAGPVQLGVFLWVLVL